MKKSLKINWLTLLILSTIILSGYIILGSLVATNIIHWSWLTGYTIGLMAFLFIIPIISFSVKILLLSENIYFYLVLFLVRVGVIFVPFLFAIYLPHYFSVFGILVAIVPYVCHSLYRYFTQQGHRKKSKGGE